jgi:hypothetical protein
MLKTIAPWVNRCIVNWALEKRKVQIFFNLPSPDDVFIMQSNGARCISIFKVCLLDEASYSKEPEDLIKIFQDEYPPYEARDCLGFSLHDLQHLEKFYDEKFYCEQVGLMTVLNRSPPHRYEPFQMYDQDFFRDVDHFISDMNACSIHLLKFFLAKWRLAEGRRRRGNVASDSLKLTAEEDRMWQEDVRRYLSELKFPSELISRVQSETLDVETAGLLRRYFHQMGEERLGIKMPLIE